MPRSATRTARRILKNATPWTVILFLGFASCDGQAADPVYENTVRPLLDKHCGACHGAVEPKGGLNLKEKQPGKPTAPLRNIQTLDKIAERLRSQTMPPPEGDNPLSDEDREVILAWVDDQIDQRLGGNRNPGRVMIRRLTKVDYRNTIRDLLGLNIDTRDFPSDDVAHGFDNLAAVISLPPLLLERYADAAESLASRWWEREIKSNDDKRPSAGKNVRNLAAEILLPLQRRAFRRPTTELEHHYLLAFFDQCLEKEFLYDEAIRACVTRILISPQFLFRIEKDGPIGRDYRLDDFELATRLSYFIWSSMPDDELFDVAGRGELQQGDNLKQQVQRMLQDPKVRQGLVENFAGQWLQTRRLQAIRPDQTLFTEFDDQLRKAMQQETLRLFETIVREDRPITELLDADYTFVNQRLASHYGIPGVKGESFQRVSLRGTRRRGVLTHASVLAINAHPTRTSPVLRGKWIMEAILGTPPPPPVADAGELESVKVEGTLRMRLEVHRANPRCASCHDRMDTLGLAFEHFDPIGRWRAKDGKRPIDPSGELPAGGRFENALELVQLLRRKHASDFRKNLAEQLLIYALGRTLGMYDRLPVRRIVTHVADHDDRFSSLVLAIAESDGFRLRRNPGRIGIEKLGEPFVFDLTGNPDQQSILKLRPNPHANPPPSVQEASFELHSLKPLLNASTSSGSKVDVGKPAGGPQGQAAFRYPVTAPIGEPVYLSFLEGMIGPKEYSDDFLKPIATVAESDEPQVLTIANSSHRWNGALVGPANIRPGSLVAFDFDVRLVAKPRDTVSVFLATPGGTNSSMFANAGNFRVEGEGTHRLTQVGRRRPTTHDAWNNAITLVVKTQTQTVIGNVSPIHVIRPQLGLSDSSTIRFAPLAVDQPAESAERRVFNAQKTILTDHNDQPWRAILYGLTQVETDPKRAYFMTTKHVGVALTGKHADRFELVGENVSDNGRVIKLVGPDDEPGLKGGPQPEHELFRVKFRGAPNPGNYMATVRVVTQAGNLGIQSGGKENEPLKGLYYVDIPVEAKVK